MGIFDFSDPIITQRRTEYVLTSEDLVVENSKVVLREIPDRVAKVQVTGGNVSIWIEKATGSLDTNNYKVDYNGNVISFHSSANEKSLHFEYMATGLNLIPTSIIYDEVNSQGNVVSTLKDIITEGKSAITALSQVNTAIQNAQTATTSATTQSAYAQQQGDYSKTQGDYAKTQGDTAATNASNAQTQANNAQTQAGNAQTVANALTHRGNYNNTVTYVPLNITYYSGSTFMCLENSTGNLPSNSSTYWRKIHTDNFAGVFNLSTVYSYGDSVVDSANQAVYKCLVDGTTNIILSNATNWQVLITVTTVINNATAATDSANSAASAASSSASLANVAASAANTSKDNANVATTNANAATTAASNAADLANSATTAANQSKTNADSSATLANNAAASASAVSTSATNAANLANSAADAANAAKTNANTASANAITSTANANDAAALASSAATDATNSATNANTINTNVQNAEAIRATQEQNRQTNTTAAINNLNNKTASWSYFLDYDNTVAYKVNNTFTYNGDSYIAISDAPVGTPPTDTTYFRIFARKGADGAGTVASVSPTNGDILVGGTAQDVTLTLNSSVVATPNTIGKRDSGGRLQSATPVSAQDVVIKSYYETGLVAKADLDVNGKVLASQLPNTDWANIINKPTSTVAQIDNTVTKVAGIATSATKTAASFTNGNVLINDAETVVYTHPSGAGNNHIPTGGANGQILKNTGVSGVADWSLLTPADIVTDANNRFVTDADKTTWNAKGNGTVTSVTSANSDASVTTTTTTPVITINTGTGTNQIVKRDVLGNLNADTVTTNANLTGDVTSIGNATTIKSNVSLAGSPTTTTQSPNDNSTKIATTAYADAIAALKANSNNATLTGTTTVSTLNHARSIDGQPQIQDYSETVATDGAVTTTKSLNISTGNVFDLTLTGNVTLTLANPAPSGQSCSITLLIRQGGTAFTITYPASVKWNNDVVPDISINSTSIISLVTVNGGTRWYAFSGGNKFTT